ncbi:hypothetical protein GGF46_000806 [Coemansia sp. RSA 552]|nr:hypothetical protein GGF46_000806 [Coemansia sp. RSA 552]
MSLAVTLYRHRLTLLVLLALGALFMLFTRSPGDVDLRASAVQQDTAPRAPAEQDGDKPPVLLQTTEQANERPPALLQTTEPVKERPPALLQTTEPVRAAKPEPEPEPEPAVVEETAAEKRMRQLIKRSRVMVFSKTYCPYSRRAKLLLTKYRNERGLDYSVLEVDLEASPAEIKEALGRISERFTFPNIFVDGQSVGGFDELNQLHDSGDLAELLGARGLIV